jgi:dipeptidyl aminopeptidase/acylaminoacyl peptidase
MTRSGGISKPDGGRRRLRLAARRLGAGFAAGLAAALLPVCASAQVPPLEVFGALPQAEFARLSPDGRYLAVVKPIDGREKAAIYDLTSSTAPPQIVGMADAMVGDVFWKSGTVAVVVFHANVAHKRSKHFRSATRAYAIDMATKRAALLMYDAPDFRKNYVGSAVVDLLADQPGFVYMVEVDRRDRNFLLDLYKVDLSTGSASQILPGDPHTAGFITDGFGHVLGRIEQDWDLNTTVIVGNSAVFEYNAKGGTQFAVAGLVADGSAFAVERPSTTGTAGLYAWTAAKGFGAPLWENSSYDIDDVIYDEHTGRVIGVTYVDDQTRTKYFDPAMQHVQDSLEKAFPGQAVEIMSRDTAGKAYVIQTQGPKNPPVISLYSTANHQVNVIDEAYPALKSARLGEVKPYPYKARDGLDIHAYLTLPPDKTAKNLPLVVFPHGGPEARDAMSFDWWAQAMATRGYAVFQPNFRGSAGYGWGFVAAGDGEWAGKVQTDVHDGVKKLIEDGTVDPKRICIVGASYGGYMALAGASFSPDLYACAVSYAGVSDLERVVDESENWESESSSIWRRRIGADKDGKKLDTAAPKNFAEKVRIPVLLIHSSKDTTVPIKQSEIENEALKGAGKQVEFVTLEGDDHYLEFGDTRTKLLKEVDRFLDAHIGH